MITTGLAIPWVARRRPWPLWTPLAALTLVVGLLAYKDDPYVSGLVVVTLVVMAPGVLGAVAIDLVRQNLRLRQHLGGPGRLSPGPAPLE